MNRQTSMTETEHEELLKLIGVESAKTNKTAARIELECEQALLEHGVKAVDLSHIPQNQHHLHDQCEVTVPEEVTNFLSGCAYPLSRDIVHMIEKKMDQVHNVVPPHGISMCLWVQQTGKPCIKLPQLISEGIITGYSYIHSDME